MCEEIFVTLRSWPVDLTQLQFTINNGHKSRQRKTTTKEALSEQNRIEKRQPKPTLYGNDGRTCQPPVGASWQKQLGLLTAAAKQRGLPFPGRMAGCNVKHPCHSFSETLRNQDPLRERGRHQLQSIPFHPASVRFLAGQPRRLREPEWLGRLPGNHFGQR